MSTLKSTLAAVAALTGLGAATAERAEACGPAAKGEVNAFGERGAKQIEKELEAETGVNHDVVELPAYDGPPTRCPMPTHKVVPAPDNDLRPHVKGKDLSQGPVLDGWDTSVERE